MLLSVWSSFCGTASAPILCQYLVGTLKTSPVGLGAIFAAAAAAAVAVCALAKDVKALGAPASTAPPMPPKLLVTTM